MLHLTSVIIPSFGLVTIPTDFQIEDGFASSALQQRMIGAATHFLAISVFTLSCRSNITGLIPVWFRRLSRNICYERAHQWQRDMQTRFGLILCGLPLLVA
jgi:hypothetical protein